jgi:hypothetical protein
MLKGDNYCPFKFVHSFEKGSAKGKNTDEKGRRGRRGRERGRKGEGRTQKGGNIPQVKPEKVEGSEGQRESCIYILVKLRKASVCDTVLVHFSFFDFCLSFQFGTRLENFKQKTLPKAQSFFLFLIFFFGKIVNFMPGINWAR